MLVHSLKYVGVLFCEFSSERGGVLVGRVVTTVFIYPSAMSNDSLALPYDILMSRNEVIAG